MNQKKWISWGVRLSSISLVTGMVSYLGYTNTLAQKDNTQPQNQGDSPQAVKEEQGYDNSNFEENEDSFTENKNDDSNNKSNSSSNSDSTSKSNSSSNSNATSQYNSNNSSSYSGNSNSTAQGSSNRPSHRRSYDTTTRGS